MTKLAGRTAIVTGASRGIGKAIALAYGYEGANVVVTARTTATLHELIGELEKTGISAVAVTADLGIENDIQSVADAALTRFGHIDILVNNAGMIHPPFHLVNFDPRLWRQVIEVNLIGAALMTRAVLPSMMAQRSGKIINISSIGGRKGAKGRSAYRASKAALISLTESVAAEAKEYGIDVNCICPGGVDTEGYRKAFANRGRADNPKLMLPEEIAALALFLASDDSSAITGASIDAFGAFNPLFA